MSTKKACTNIHDYQNFSTPIASLCCFGCFLCFYIITADKDQQTLGMSRKLNKFINAGLQGNDRNSWYTIFWFYPMTSEGFWRTDRGLIVYCCWTSRWDIIPSYGNLSMCAFRLLIVILRNESSLGFTSATLILCGLPKKTSDRKCLYLWKVD